MPDLQVPNVTIEDLQTFQAKHFLGHGPTVQIPYASDGTVENEFEDDDGLGYYPDGLKRTLTDEQIKIFRHSEIHSLLREKQLREAALLEASSESEEKNGEISEGRKLATSEASTNERPERTEGHKSSDSALDYGQDTAANSTQKNTPTVYASQFAGRKIISYDD
ncbi:hypothetical protein EYZ11_002899 [Aspergillus tanneri]|uniref:Uncharacterized protein n=1 Tax=Aspergillus tanneri TaxID=1220188 RepID=A0A4S3JPJ9_9EURO|nr:uncharacterized protein ATNIH1004_011245 [Aspergillus tanneri]KAA8642303.1 hypothetical protein ATNIH1004_011245 [Aspergillus tanneri]THC97609.1 hypothetical protein EYZ11_002899 [Aspergillus tanneri]